MIETGLKPNENNVGLGRGQRKVSSNGFMIRDSIGESGYKDKTCKGNGIQRSSRSPNRSQGRAY
mgnify:FL=1